MAYYGAPDLQLDPGLKNGDFEQGNTAWSPDGSADTLTGFGTIVPWSDKRFLAASTFGNGTRTVTLETGSFAGTHTLKGSVQQSFVLPDDFTGLSIDTWTISQEWRKDWVCDPVDLNTIKGDLAVLQLAKYGESTGIVRSIGGANLRQQYTSLCEDQDDTKPVSGVYFPGSAPVYSNFQYAEAVIFDLSRAFDQNDFAAAGISPGDRVTLTLGVIDGQPELGRHTMVFLDNVTVQKGSAVQAILK